MKSNNLYVQPSDRSLSRNRAMAGLSVAGLTAIAGIAALPRTTTDMDGAEFALIAAKGGIAHPPGYPLYSAMLRLWHECFARWFAVPPEITSPAALALLSVLVSTVAAWVLWDGIMRWQERPGREPYRTGSGPWCVAAAVLCVMLASPVWRASTGIEPFALNNLMAACLVWIAATALTSRPAATERCTQNMAFATGLLFGLAFCNHHSLAFAAPMALPALAGSRRRLTRAAIWGTVSGFVTGLLPMVWFLLEMDSTAGLVWGDWSRFLARLPVHIFRRDYGTLSLTSGATGHWWNGPRYLVTVFEPGLTWVWSAIALAGMAATLRQITTRQTRSHATLEGLAIACFLTTGFLMSALFRLEPTPDSAAIMDRFAALPLIFLATPIAGFLYRVTSIVDHGLRPAPQRLILAFLAMALVFQAAHQFSRSDRGRESIADLHIRASLAALRDPLASSDSGRVWIVTNTDVDFFGFQYWTADMIPRPVIVQTGLWTSVWYRKKILKDLGQSGVVFDPALTATLEERIPEDLAFAALSRILIGAARQGRVFLSTGNFPKMDALLDVTYPVASFVRVLTPGPETSASVPSHQDIVDANVKYSAPLLKALAANPCNTAWECYSLEGWRRTWMALEVSSRAIGDQSQLKICAAHLNAIRTREGL
ncbi:DUF2723 domain-containing protein [bacterium]|nr:DUF2723 domain-containing protein [bacterium]